MEWGLSGAKNTRLAWARIVAGIESWSGLKDEELARQQLEHSL